jgi:hypothetical protein
MHGIFWRGIGGSKVVYCEADQEIQLNSSFAKKKASERRPFSFTFCLKLQQYGSLARP